MFSIYAINLDMSWNLCPSSKLGYFEVYLKYQLNLQLNFLFTYNQFLGSGGTCSQGNGYQMKLA